MIKLKELNYDEIEKKIEILPESHDFKLTYLVDVDAFVLKGCIGKEENDKWLFTVLDDVNYRNDIERFSALLQDTRDPDEIKSYESILDIKFELLSEYRTYILDEILGDMESLDIELMCTCIKRNVDGIISRKSRRADTFVLTLPDTLIRHDNRLLVLQDGTDSVEIYVDEDGEIRGIVNDEEMEISVEYNLLRFLKPLVKRISGKNAYVPERMMITFLEYIHNKAIYRSKIVRHLNEIIPGVEYEIDIKDKRILISTDKCNYSISHHKGKKFVHVESYGDDKYKKDYIFDNDKSFMYHLVSTLNNKNPKFTDSMDVYRSMNENSSEDVSSFLYNLYFLDNIPYYNAVDTFIDGYDDTNNDAGLLTAVEDILNMDKLNTRGYVMLIENNDDKLFNVLSNRIPRNDGYYILSIANIHSGISIIPRIELGVYSGYTYKRINVRIDENFDIHDDTCIFTDEEMPTIISGELMEYLFKYCFSLRLRNILISKLDYSESIEFDKYMASMMGINLDSMITKSMVQRKSDDRVVLRTLISNEKVENEIRDLIRIYKEKLTFLK